MGRFFLIAAIFFSVSANIAAQEDKGVKRQSMADRRKELARKKEEQKRKDEEAMEQLKMMHLENQDKQTQKRMKKAQKKADRHNAGKSSFSLRGWFARKKRY
jgi:ABC-type branched-subunit amino acid transport system ATPase component